MGQIDAPHITDAHGGSGEHWQASDRHQQCASATLGDRVRAPILYSPLYSNTPQKAAVLGYTAVSLGPAPTVALYSSTARCSIQLTMGMELW